MYIYKTHLSVQNFNFNDQNKVFKHIFVKKWNNEFMAYKIWILEPKNKFDEIFLNIDLILEGFSLYKVIEIFE